MMGVEGERLLMAALVAGTQVLAERDIVDWPEVIHIAHFTNQINQVGLVEMEGWQGQQAKVAE